MPRERTRWMLMVYVHAAHTLKQMSVQYVSEQSTYALCSECMWALRERGFVAPLLIFLEFGFGDHQLLLLQAGRVVRQFATQQRRMN